ncbi:MAG: DNA repair protein RecN [Eubacteriales bacterium]|nr:DNA repair protein RecN [Eubacteriales bacterium]
MLIELTIRNIALIESLRIPFGPGLNILTGETGAGKSIVVDAVSLALGGRADRELIRSGTQSASVQAAFDISDCPAAKEMLAQYGIDPGDDVITVGRELSSSGRNICRICGAAATLSQLRALTALLMDMHGQHEHARLLEPSAHLAFLDECGDEEHRQLVLRVRNAYEAYAAAEKELRAANEDIAQRERLADMLRYQIAEIDEIKPKKGEYDKLEARAKLYEHAELIAEKVDIAYAQAYAGSGRSAGAQEALKKAMNAMGAIAEYDARFSALHERLEESYYLVQDIGLELQDIREGLDHDPGKLARIEDRLDALKRLMRKYGPQIEDVLAFRADAAERLEALDNADERRDRLEKALKKEDAAYSALCVQLTESRGRIAEHFCSAVRAELAELGMPKLRFEARFAPKMKLHSPTGTDVVELLISPNPGEPLKPMASIASGGELARIMLAFKTVQNQQGGAGTMVFDEIDTGVSGRMAQAVGEKMARIGFAKQVICVTHLPQIAAIGDQQYLVEKHEENGRTETNVRLLDENGRAAELARLVGGAEDDGSAFEHAQSMIRQAARRREELRAKA